MPRERAQPPPFESDEYIPFVRDLVREHDVRAVVPLTDLDIEILAGADQGWADDTVYNYAIMTGDVLVGGISLMARIGPGGLEIGYWVHQEHARRGLATAATAALVEQAFRLPGVDRLEIVHDELNVASGGVPRKLGFTEVERRAMDVPAAEGNGVGVVWRLVR